MSQHPLQQMASYEQEFFVTKEKSNIPLKLGVEIDFFPDDVERIRDFIQKHPFDYVIGAVHFMEIGE
ncbi:MAG: hypothetical protein QW667_04735 [Candidatus Bathyarchaeia archaeon]